METHSKPIFITLLGIGMIAVLILTFAAVTHRSPFALFSKADQKTAVLSVQQSPSAPDEYLLFLDTKGETVSFVRIEAEYDKTTTSIGEIKNTSPLLQSGTAPNMIFVSSPKSVAATGKIALVLGARLQDAAPTSPIIDIASIKIQSKEGKSLSKKQDAPKTITVLKDRSQIITADGVPMGLDVVYAIPQPTGSTTKRKK